MSNKLPEGFRLLPVEATDSMMDADWDVSMSEAHSNGGVAAAAWRAMVEAAPQVTYGNGHSGYGWYMHDTDYPEEGAVFLSDETPAQSPAAASASSADQIRKLREALKPFSNYACSPPGACDCHNCRARAAIKETE
jgi:hypothetical protein